MKLMKIMTKSSHIMKLFLIKFNDNKITMQTFSKLQQQNNCIKIQICDKIRLFIGLSSFSLSYCMILGF